MGRPKAREAPTGAVEVVLAAHEAMAQDRLAGETPGFAIRAPGAYAFLKARGYSVETLGRWLDSVFNASPVIWRRRGGNPVERAALWALAGESPPLELFELALREWTRRGKQAEAAEARDERDARAFIATLARRWHDHDPSMSRSKIVACAQRGEFPPRRGGRSPVPASQYKEAGPKLLEIAREYETRTLRKWIQEECPEIGQRVGRPSTKKPAAR